MFKRLGAFFLDVLEVIVFAVGIFFFIYLLIMRPHRIQGQSMMPNFPDREYLLTERVSYYLHGPQRGDVIVFVPPPISANIGQVSCGNTPETSAPTLEEYVKRVIGLPGEKIKIKDGHIYINGELLKEPYLKDDIVTSPGPFLCEDQEYTIPNGKYIVLGDNRPNSSDSRYWGPVPLNLSPNTDREGINGRAWIIYWPIKLAGVVKNPNYNF
jgi:signal peptidase I